MERNVDEDMAMRRRRAYYRASHRGTREMDYLFGRFAEATVETMTPVELSVFETILTFQDPVLTAALVDGVGEFDDDITAMMQRIRRFHRDGKA